MRQRKRDAEQHGNSSGYVQTLDPPLPDPRHVIDAVVVAEDGTFYSHGGVDWFEVQESIEKNIKERKAARGATRSRSNWQEPLPLDVEGPGAQGEGAGDHAPPGARPEQTGSRALT